MRSSRCCVVIPIYKEHLENFEVLSLHRVFLVLGKTYDIKFLTYRELNIQEYTDITSIYGFPVVERIHFSKKYFVNNCGTLGYNFIMTNKKLYGQLLQYEYILIYHLDCYIFKNDLEYWMDEGYPNVECVIDNETHNGTNNMGRLRMEGQEVRGFQYNGEGLRNTKAFYEYLDNNKDKVARFQLNVVYGFLFDWNDRDKNVLSEDEYIAEDGFFTYLNEFIIRNFGWSNMYKEKFEEFGQLPTMLHWFQKYEWSKEYIGDWDNDLNNCINNPKFAEMKLV